MATAVIDLKNTTISLEDGYSVSGLVNNVAGYSIGATSIIVDGFTGIVETGVRIEIGTNVGHTIVSVANTLGNTTTIVITPGLTAAVLDNVAVVAGPRFLDIRVGDGNLTWSEKRPIEYKKDRGRLYQVREGDEEPMDVSLQLLYEELTASSGNPPTPEDVLKQRGEASDWDTTDTTAGTCAPYAVNLVLVHQPDGCDVEEREKVVLPFFRYEELAHDPKAGTVSTTGKCNAVEATITRYS